MTIGRNLFLALPVADILKAVEAMYTSVITRNKQNSVHLPRCDRTLEKELQEELLNGEQPRQMGSDFPYDAAETAPPTEAQHDRQDNVDGRHKIYDSIVSTNGNGNGGGVCKVYTRAEPPPATGPESVWKSAQVMQGEDFLNVLYGACVPLRAQHPPVILVELAVLGFGVPELQAIDALRITIATTQIVATLRQMVVRFEIDKVLLVVQYRLAPFGVIERAQIAAVLGRQQILRDVLVQRAEAVPVQVYL
uniref:Uncharacterized protein n=1 Tax=Anopheles farauti TaxID=69004 RepID=A0A182QIE0_9DIPT